MTGQRVAAQLGPAIRRSGLSLLEIVLCLSILAVSGGMVAQLLEVGRVASQRAELTAAGILHAERTLAELIGAGEVPVATAGALPDDEDWNFTVEVEPTEWETLHQVRIKLEHVNRDGASDARVELVRWFRAAADVEESSL